MAGKKVPPPERGSHGVKAPPGKARKSSAETEGQFAKDPKGRKGQFTGAGDSSLMKK